jgi:hypothetical protein
MAAVAAFSSLAVIWPHHARAIEALAPRGDEKSAHQFPELPDVLYYEGFELAAITWKNGKIDTTTIQGPDNPHSYKLGDKPKATDKSLSGSADFPIKLPPGLDANDVHIQFMLWTDEPGELSVKFKDGDFEEKPHVLKLKTWAPITLRLSDTSKDKKRPTKEVSFRGVEVSFKPKEKKAASVYIDDFIITCNTKPADIVRQVMALDSKRGLVIRAAEKDGFTFAGQMIESLQNVAKHGASPRKPKTILVVGAQSTETGSLVQELGAQAAKAKPGGFSFLPATTPDGVPVGGLDDMRILLPYNTLKNDAGMVLLVLSATDAQKPGAKTDSVRVVLERALEAGCVPILCLPPIAPPQKGKKTSNPFAGLPTICLELGVPWIDESFCAKPAKPGEKGEAAAISAAGLPGLAMQAIQHIDANVFSRR